jgi:hypothetical protein
MWWARLLNNIAALFGTGTVAGDYESIATTVVGAGTQATISFTVIPSTYKHLQVRAICRANGGTSNYSGGLQMNFNSDTAANYNGHQLYGLGSGSAGAGVPLGSNPVSAIWLTTGSNQFGAHVIDILDYANTNKFKTIRTLAGSDNNGGGAIVLESGAWRSTSAITRIDFAISGVNFAQYSHFALYGIKG